LLRIYQRIFVRRVRRNIQVFVVDPPGIVAYKDGRPVLSLWYFDVAETCETDYRIAS
jgi:hypothetical protein